MREHVAAIEALLSSLELPVYYVDVPDAPPRAYLILWGSNGLPGSEQSVEPIGDLEDLVGVTSVADTAHGVLTLRQRVRGVLDGAHPAVAGRSVQLHLADSRRTEVDRDVTPHVPYGVDLYRLISVPA